MTKSFWKPKAIESIFCITNYNDVLMSVMTSQITSLTIVNSTVCLRRRSKKHHSSASLALVRGIHGWTVNSRTKGQQRGKCFHLMTSSCTSWTWYHSFLWLELYFMEQWNNSKDFYSFLISIYCLWWEVYTLDVWYTWLHENYVYGLLIFVVVS